MFRTFYIKPSERGILYHRSDFKRVLRPGTHRFLGWHWQVKTFDLNQPEAKLENPELLLQSHNAQIRQHFHVVRTGFNEAALVRTGQRWLLVSPDQLLLFWRGFVEVEIFQFNLEENRELPQNLAQQLHGNFMGIKQAHIAEFEIGLLYVDDNFVRPLEPGDYGFWTYRRKVEVRSLNRTQPNPVFPFEDVLIEQHPQFVADYCTAVELGGEEVAIVRHKGKAIAVLPPHSRKLFWRDAEVERIDLQAAPKLSQPLVSEFVSGSSAAMALALDHIHALEVSAQHVGLLYLDGALQATLSAGTHVWWEFGRSFKSEAIDLRLQSLEVSGQEILSKDKVPLRLNLTADYRVVDAVQARTALKDIPGFLYKELQFALRGAVGTKNLDALLEDKGAIDQAISEYMAQKVPDYGLELRSVGVKDIILPGEIKAILGQVVAAEKSAQANVIRRREETAATRSMLNTAKVMEDNPIALRLKELEVLERIAEKIEKINVNGSLDSILTELISIKA